MTTNQKGFTLLELMIITIIIGILALMASVMLLDAGEKSKLSAVRANVAAAISSVEYKLTNEDLSVEDIITEIIEELNNPDGIDDSGDELKSPFKKSVRAFIDTEDAEPGQVSLIYVEDEDVVKVKGYGPKGSNASAIISKAISTSLISE